MNVLIIDSHTLYGEGLRQILINNFSISKVYLASNLNTADAITKKSKFGIDLVLFAINNQNECYLDILKQFISINKNTLIIAIVSDGNLKYYDSIYDTAVRGVILKTYTASQITNVIRNCCSGFEYIPIEIQDIINNKSIRCQIATSLHLTKRQLEVLDLIEKRMTNDEIAERLFVSISTVKTHISKIYSTLEVCSRKECIRRSYDLGVLS